MTTTDAISPTSGPGEQAGGGLPSPLVTIEVGATPIAPPAAETAPDGQPPPPPATGDAPAMPSPAETAAAPAADTTPAEAAPPEPAAPRVAPASILAVDIGG
ncbi:MAG TPA: hypothetical protein VEL76_13570, partial [Gemmataceae bacterium]|nr:hypothetical protein [Gemmataceae bacterium]